LRKSFVAAAPTTLAFHLEKTVLAGSAGVTVDQP
jgi:hypothetical protein